MDKFIKFMRFVLDYKSRRLVRKFSNRELLDLYYRFSPAFWKGEGTIFQRALGGIVVMTVGEEFKSRFPYKGELLRWDYKEQLNLYELITGGGSK